MTKNISMHFLTAGGKSAVITLKNAKTDVTHEEVSSAMDDIISNNIFKAADGTDFVSKDSAEIIDRNVTELL